MGPLGRGRSAGGSGGRARLVGRAASAGATEAARVGWVGQRRRLSAGRATRGAAERWATARLDPLGSGRPRPLDGASKEARGQVGPCLHWVGRAGVSPHPSRPPPPRPVGTVPRQRRAAFVHACNAHPLCRCDWRGQPPVGAVGEDGQSHLCVLPGFDARAGWGQDKFPHLICISFPASFFLSLRLRTLPFDSPSPSLLLFPHRKPLRADLCRGGHRFGDLGRGTPIVVGFLDLSSSISGNLSVFEQQVLRNPLVGALDGHLLKGGDQSSLIPCLGRLRRLEGRDGGLWRVVGVPERGVGLRC